MSRLALSVAPARLLVQHYMDGESAVACVKDGPNGSGRAGHARRMLSAGRLGKRIVGGIDKHLLACVSHGRRPQVEAP
jgi:hypothetical protein